MPKLDVGVGDEFPTEEIIRDENGVVHHHHYYRRRPYRPFGFLRFMLGLLLIGMLVRLFDDNSWMDWGPSWMLHGYFSLVRTLVSIAVVVGVLFFLCRRDYSDRPW